MTMITRLEDVFIDAHNGPAFRILECHEVPKAAPRGCAQVVLVTTYDLNGCIGKVIHSSYGAGCEAEIRLDVARKRDRWAARMEADWNGVQS